MNDMSESAAKKFKAKNNLIGRYKYNHLKQLKSLTEDQKIQVEAYEQMQNKDLTPDQKTKTELYRKKIMAPENKTIYKFDPEQLLELYFNRFVEMNLDDEDLFIKNDDTKLNIISLIYYFAKDKRFFKCSNIHQEFKFKNKTRYSYPSFDKSLLIIGHYGNGKTTVMSTFQSLFSRLYGHKFRKHSANDVV